MKLKNLETENFRVTVASNKYNIKAITPMARAYLRLKNKPNPDFFGYQATNETETVEALLAYVSDLEAGVAKLAAI